MRSTAAPSSRAASIIWSAESRISRRFLRACAKPSKAREAYLEQNNPHPDPLPSDGRGYSQTCRSQLPKRLGTSTYGGRFNLSDPMGEGKSSTAPRTNRCLSFPNDHLHYTQPRPLFPLPEGEGQGEGK